MKLGKLINKKLSHMVNKWRFDLTANKAGDMTKYGENVTKESYFDSLYNCVKDRIREATYRCEAGIVFTIREPRVFVWTELKSKLESEGYIIEDTIESKDCQYQIAVIVW